MCLIHLNSLIQGAELKNMFWKAAKSNTPEEFESVMQEIKKINRGAHDWLRRHDPKIWCRGFFSFFSKTDSVDNNLCECFNGTIIDARYKPIIQMLEDIRIGVNERMEKRRSIIDKWKGEFCPRIIDRLDTNIANNRGFCTHPHGNGKFEVRMGMTGYVVNTNTRSCTCRMWELNGIPCVHSISCIYWLRDDPKNYIDDYLRIEKCKLAYQESLSPLNGKNMWPKDDSDPILPPTKRRMPGRPKKARRKGVNEESKESSGSVRISGSGRDMNCTNCHQAGHNRRSCKNPTVPKTKVNIITNSV